MFSKAYQLAYDYWHRDSCRLCRINNALPSLSPDEISFLTDQDPSKVVIYADFLNGKLVRIKATRQMKANARIRVTKLMAGIPLTREGLSRAGKSRVERATVLARRPIQSPLTKGLTAGIALSMEQHRTNLVDDSQGPLFLTVRRGKFLKIAAYCSVCHTPVAPLYRYADSNYGPVILCSVCKTQAFERSFGHADAMPLAVDHAHAHKGKW